MKFFEALGVENERLNTCLCVGVDPSLRGWSGFLEDQITKLGPANYFREFSRVVTDAAKGKVSSIKFQSAYFEAAGAAGVEALKSSIAYAREQSLLTIYDAKRGDIGSTLAAYGMAAFDYLEADAMTFVPYMGVSTLDAISDYLERGKGIYVVTRSSNPEGGRIQSDFNDGGIGAAEIVLSEIRTFCQTKQAELGAVWGAQNVEEWKSSTAIPLLVPGVGAQGAVVGDALKNLLSQNAASLLPISRGITGKPGEIELQSWLGLSSYVSERVDYWIDTIRN